MSTLRYGVLEKGYVRLCLHVDMREESITLGAFCIIIQNKDVVGFKHTHTYTGNCGGREPRNRS